MRYNSAPSDMSFRGLVIKTSLCFSVVWAFIGTAHFFLAGAQEKSSQSAKSTQTADLEGFQTKATPVLKQYCFRCHGPERKEAKLDLSVLSGDLVKGKDADAWAKVLERIDKGEMPPDGAKGLSVKDRRQLTGWIAAELTKAGRIVVRHDRVPSGNHVDHAKLFDPNTNAPLHNPPRLWRLSPEIYEQFIDDVARRSQGTGQPFTSNTSGGFKDQAGAQIDEPVAVQLFNNALVIVKHQTAHKFEKGEIRGIGSVPREFLELLDPKSPPTEKQMEAAVKRQFEHILRRQPDEKELQRFVALMKKNLKEAGQVIGARYTLATVLLLPETIYRLELGQGPPDDKGRVRLAPREIAFAIAYAVTDRRPDSTLLAAADNGELDTKEGVAKHVRRLLDDPRHERKPRLLRFFQEYFGYTAATDVFKDNKDNPDHDARVLVEDTDQLIRYILDRDQNVLYELLTTNKSFVAYKQAEDIKKRRAKELERFKKDNRPNKKLRKIGKDLYAAYNLSDFPDQQPVDLPKEERAGILTQPSWLVANSANDDNHPIHRGEWIREKLLGGTIPDVPITVDAQLPEDPKKTLRERMAVTRQNYCWQCHQKMNPLGLTFEIYDHYGKYRTEELERPVDAMGKVDLTGDPRIEGDVKNAIEMLKKLAKSERVEQVFVRHAFRYWMGRSENLGDAASLQEAYRAYKQSGGSMTALVTALVTSESFLYRSVQAKSHPR